MKSFIQVIKDMHGMFGETWTKDQMPVWMQALHTEISKADTPMNIRIFILKIILNLQDIFIPYAKFWFKPIGAYITSKNNGGLGLHYFT
jgi:DNA-dependent protein kinase catalytic subunit